MTLGKVIPQTYFINNIQLEKVTFIKIREYYLRITFNLINILIIFVKKLIFL